ncbi:hypothetical protein QY96_00131 [Bacillus thermotolerans]|nr:hypothetical protein QY96_00131 [Bacillus thermotolerans]
MKEPKSDQAFRFFFWVECFIALKGWGYVPRSFKVVKC